MTIRELKAKIEKIDEEYLDNHVLILDELTSYIGVAQHTSKWHSYLYNDDTPKTIGGMANYDLENKGLLIYSGEYYQATKTLHPDIKRGFCFGSEYPRVTADDKFNKKFNKGRIPLTKVLEDYKTNIHI